MGYYITIQFKDKDKVFKGRTYDFRLNDNVSPPSVGSIIRMYKPDGHKMCNATRVKVLNVMRSSAMANDDEPIEYELASLDD